MNETRTINNFFTKFRSIIVNNARNIILTSLIIFSIFISYQIYDYFRIQEIKKSSISFYKSLESGDLILEKLLKVKSKKNIYSILTKLELIKINNENKEFNISNELYKELMSSNNINELYKSSIAVHAAYTLINATLNENTNIFLDDILYYISNVNDDFDNYHSIKKELEYLYLVTRNDINQLKYKNNSEIIDFYEELINSSLVSTSVKERVKNIHEFYIYK